MLYSYYMKINIITAFLLVAVALLPAKAQDGRAVVVKQDGDKIYLDISSLTTKVNKGDSFKIITDTEQLINPATGKDLGNIYKYSPLGVITEVQPLYAVGEIKQSAQYDIGAQAVFEKPSHPAPKTNAAISHKGKSTRGIITYQPVEQTIIGLTEGTLTAPNQIITLNDKGQITVYTPQEEALIPVLTASLPAGTEPIAISSVDVKQTGRSQIFAAFYNPSRKSIFTAVLEDENGKLQTTDTLNFFAKELGCTPDKTLWGQIPFVLGDRPGNARKVLFSEGKFSLDKQDQNTRRQWLTGLNFYPYAKGQTGLIYTTTSGTLKAQTDKEL